MAKDRRESGGEGLSAEVMDEYLRSHVFIFGQQEQREGKPWERVGVELEAFSVKTFANGELEGVIGYARDLTAGFLLEQARRHGWKVHSERWVQERWDEHVVIGFYLPQGGTITFEPAKQIEFSSRPHSCFEELIAEAERYHELILEGIHWEDPQWGLLSLGSYPFPVPASDAEGSVQWLHVPKRRYRKMARYFHCVDSPYGAMLMQQSCATQVCVDTGPTEQAMVQRYALAQMLAPYVFGIFASSPFLGGKLHSSYRNCRAEVVLHYDPSRAGLDWEFLEEIYRQEQALKQSTCVRSYRNMVLRSTYVDIQSDEETHSFPPFGQWMQQQAQRGESLTLEDFKRQLGAIFPEVRVKGFFELRTPDAQLPPWTYVPVTFYLGILWDEAAREQCFSLLYPMIPHMKDLWLESRYGLQQPRLAEHGRKIMEYAIEGANRLCQHKVLGDGGIAQRECALLERYAQHFTFQGRTPSDDIVDVLQKDGGRFRMKTLHLLEETWQDHSRRGP